jgi:hypothetical protein
MRDKADFYKKTRSFEQVLKASPHGAIFFMRERRGFNLCSDLEEVSPPQ